MKRINLVIIALLTLAFAFCGCASNDVWEVPSVTQSSSKQSVVEKNRMLWSSSKSDSSGNASVGVGSFSLNGQSKKSKTVSSNINHSFESSLSSAGSYSAGLQSSTAKNSSKSSNGTNSVNKAKKSVTASKSTVSKTKTDYSADNTAGTMVWIPQSGSKYHSKAGCSKMKSPTKVTKEKAESMGYTPCKRCY